MRLDVIDNHRSRFVPVSPGWHQRKMRFAVKSYQTKKNEDENPTVLSLTKTGLKVKTDLSFGKSTENYVGHQIVERGQFVFTPRDFDATPILCGVADTPGCISNLYIVFEVSPHIDARFLEYYFWGLKYGFEFFEKLSFGMRYSFNRTQFENIPLLHPDLATQRQIADFLDRETARIDLLIEKKQRLVALLGEKRQSGIVSAVTLGLNERVDLKDTGVSWVPQIPKHWELRKVKHLGKPIIGLTYAPDDLVSEGEGTAVLRANNIQAGKLQSENLVYVSSAVSQKLRLREGDILICSLNGSRNLIGKNAMVSSEFSGMTFGAFNTVLRSKHSDFLYWVLQSPIFDHQAGSFLTSTINQLTISTLSNLVVPFAPPEEQEAICKHLRERERIFDASAKTLSTSIDRLKDYRSALITAAVTGQIDVQTYAKSGTPDRRLDAIQKEMQA